MFENPTALDRFQILTIPGGFSYGDDLGAGRILATRLATTLGEALWRFHDHGGLVLGICNGFQVLVRRRPSARRLFGRDNARGQRIGPIRGQMGTPRWRTPRPRRGAVCPTPAIGPRFPTLRPAVSACTMDGFPVRGSRTPKPRHGLLRRSALLRRSPLYRLAMVPLGSRKRAPGLTRPAPTGLLLTYSRTRLPRCRGEWASIQPGTCPRVSCAKLFWCRWQGRKILSNSKMLQYCNEMMLSQQLFISAFLCASGAAHIRC